MPGIGGGRVDAYAALLAAGANAALRVGGQPFRLRRFLRTTWHLKLTVQGSRLAATLRSPKARACAVSLTSPDSVWVGSNHGTAESLVATVAAGKYQLDVSCKSRRPRLASLTVRSLAQ